MKPDEKAEYYHRRAAAAESERAILSDDPNAEEKLEVINKLAIK